MNNEIVKDFSMGLNCTVHETNRSISPFLDSNIPDLELRENNILVSSGESSRLNLFFTAGNP